MNEKQCAVCGKSFIPHKNASPRAKYCSRECYKEGQRRIHVHPPRQRECTVCGQTFVTQGQGQRTRYCSEACLRAARSTARLAFEGEVQVGRAFIRAHDRTWVKVVIDQAGLPCADPVKPTERIVRRNGIAFAETAYA